MKHSRTIVGDGGRSSAGAQAVSSVTNRTGNTGMQTATAAAMLQDPALACSFPA